MKFQFQLFLCFTLALATLLAGCIDTSEAVDGATLADPAPVADATAEPTLVSFDGDFGVGYLACPMVTCVNDFMAAPERFDTHDLQGTVDVRLSATWDASTPLYDELILGVFSCRIDCKGDDEVSAMDFAWGASGVALDVEGFEVAEGEVLWVFMHVRSLTPSPTYSAVYTPQDFHVEGTLTPRS